MRVRICAPSGPFDPHRLDAGVRRMKALGLSVEQVDGLRGDHAYLNGDDDARAQALNEALASDVDVVWLARGGYGLTRIIDRIQQPKRAAVVGFSDASALLAKVYAGGGRAIHGPLATTLADESDASAQHMLACLRGQGASFDALIGDKHTSPVHVEGPLFATNLCLLATLIGTSTLPDLSGHIVALEDVGERPYRIDRMATQLLQAGVLVGVKAVVLGSFFQCEEPPGRGFQGRAAAPSAVDVLRERFSGVCPVVSGLPFGHVTPNFALPLGATATLAWQDEHARLSIAAAT